VLTLKTSLASKNVLLTAFTKVAGCFTSSLMSALTAVPANRFALLKQSSTKTMSPPSGPRSPLPMSNSLKALGRPEELLELVPAIVTVLPAQDHKE
jgi:hypothetical protein